MKLCSCSSAPLLCTACLDGVVRLWDGRNGSIVQQWEGHDGHASDSLLPMYIIVMFFVIVIIILVMI